MQYSKNNNQAAAENIKIGQEFLEENKQAEGVKTTASGLQYLVLQEGTGTEHPKASDKVTVHYHGTLIDGTVFDSSVERGETIAFGLNQVIKGWTEGLQLMVEGEKTRLFIPAELAYGNRATGGIPAGSVLIFDVELIGIN
ncbi:FKBP-type peptidyl-prolyl cis-trans isomerase [Photobacterium sp.]|uniref:FKBP-type peptidyl-prolyl cis-trans isomerase n=1 Tax=Photobacterium sp. TaxID=660 RepID=UPI0039AF2600